MARRKLAELAVSVTFLVIASVFLTPSPVRSQEANSGTYGAAFLGIPIGARSMTLPEVVAGMQPNASLAFSNPAALTSLNSGQVFFTTARWLDDLSLSAASIVVPVNSLDLKWYLGSRLMYAGGLEGFNSTNQVVSEESFYDMTISTGVSTTIDRLGVNVGIGTTYLREHFPLEDGTAVTYSFGATYYHGKNRINFIAKDWGGDLKFQGRTYPIDTRYIMGVGRSLNRQWGNMDLGGQVTFTESQSKRFQLGLAYHPNMFFTLRTGLDKLYKTDTSGMPLSAGMGFQYNRFSLDYAYTGQEFFATTHTFSLTYSFGKMTKPKAAARSSSAMPVVSEPLSTQGQPPVAFEKPIQNPAKRAQKARKAETTTFAVVAGTHGREASARAEARALRLLKIPAVIEAIGTRYRVVVGKYDSLKQAQKAVEGFRRQGHVFEAVAD